MTTKPPKPQGLTKPETDAYNDPTDEPDDVPSQPEALTPKPPEISNEFDDRW